MAQIIGTNIRVQHLVLTQAGQVPTMPSPVTIDPSDDRWKSTDIMKGEWAHNVADDVWFYRRNNNTIATINLNAIGGSGGGLENRYDTVALMIAEQGNQTDKGLQFVSDASGDSTITSGYAYYEYLGTTNGNLTDYRVVTKQEILSGTSIIALIDAEIGTDWKTSGGTSIGAGKRTYSTTTTEPPSSGQLRLNHATPGSATEAYVHDSDGTTDWSGLLNKGVAGSVLKAIKDDSNYWMFDVTGKTDETGYVKYGITPLVIVGTISNEDEVTIELDVSGGGTVENSSETVAGIVEEGTQDQVNDSGNSGTGETGARLFVSIPKLWGWWTNLLATATGWLTNSHMADMPALSVKVRAANSTGVPTDLQATTAERLLARNASNVLAFVQATTNMLLDRAVTLGKFVASPGNSVLAKIGSGSGDYAHTDIINVYDGIVTVTPTRILTADDDVDNGDHTILIDATSGTVTATLPDPETVVNQEFLIKLINATNSGFLDPDTFTIEGSSTDIELASLWQWVRVKAVQLSSTPTYGYIKIGGNV